MQTVLIVDDEANIRHMLRMMIEMSGYKVIEAADGIQGLEVASEAQPDLIVLDVMMPRLDGFSVCQQLRDQAHTRDIPILLVSGDSVNGRSEAKYEKVADRFLRKPFQFELLLSHIEQLITQSSQVS